MEDKIKKIKWALLDNGFLTATRIKNEAIKMGCSIDEINQIFTLLNQDGEIKKIQYTNRFLVNYCTRDLYYYKPKAKKKTKKV